MAATTSNKKKIRRFLYWILFLAYLILLFYFLFFAENFGRVGNSNEYRYNLTLFKEIKRFYVYRHIVGYKAFFVNVIGNVLAFIPFGFFMPVLFERCKHMLLTVLFSFELSLCVEVIQLIFRIGSFDVDDMFLNTIGGLIGFIIYFIVSRSERKNAHE